MGQVTSQAVGVCVANIWYQCCAAHRWERHLPNRNPITGGRQVSVWRLPSTLPNSRNHHIQSQQDKTWPRYSAELCQTNKIQSTDKTRNYHHLRQITSQNWPRQSRQTRTQRLICKATRAKRTHDLRRCLRSPPNDASWNICKPKMSSNMFDEWWILPSGSLRKCNISTKTMTLTPSVLICTKTTV